MQFDPEPMQLGVSSYAFGWAVGVAGHPPPVPWGELDLVEFARSHRLAVVQFGDHVPLHTFDAARLSRLRAAADDAGIDLEIGARGLTTEHLSRYVAVAQSLRARLLRFVIDGPDYEPTPAAVVALLRAARLVLGEAGLVLGIENHDRLPARTLREMIAAIGSDRVGVCLDTANSLGAGEGLGEVLDELAEHTVNLHVKDFAIARVPSAMGFVVEGRPAGRGLLDVAAVRDRIAPHGRCRSAILETWTPPEAQLADTLAKERRWAEESIAYLKPLFATR